MSKQQDSISKATGSSGGLILVLNCGSSSIKFALYDADQHPLPRKPMWSGRVVDIGGPNTTYTDSLTPEGPLAPSPIPDRKPYDAALDYIRAQVRKQGDGRPLIGVVHRVVHGGPKYGEPVIMDEQVLADLKSYIPLAPLHQPYSLLAIEALMHDLPDTPQIACFDTAYHQTMPKVEKQLSLPYELYERGVRRYGFHGLSYEFMAVALPEQYGDLARGKVVVAHLGSGASLCAMQDLKSQSTSMGFSALDGLMMGTRPGALDPGALLYLLEIEKMEVPDLVRLLYHKSGLLGVSGLTPEPRVLLSRENEDSEVGERIRDAMRLYVRRIIRQIGSLIAMMDGIDMLVFTAGVGENSAEIRKRVLEGMSYFGIRIDHEANQKNGPVISTPDSAVKVVVQPTNEEWIVARHAARLLGVDPS
jgi:acetate kinase